MHDDDLRAMLRKLPEPPGDEAFTDAVLSRLGAGRSPRRRPALLAASLAGAAILAAALVVGSGSPRRPERAAAARDPRRALQELRREQAQLHGQLAELAAMRREPIYLGGSEVLDVVWRPLGTEQGADEREGSTR